jgi:GGDEF domain-containing protein
MKRVTLLELGNPARFFLIIGFLLGRLRKSLMHERDLARTDTLTGAFNSRFFAMLAQRELDIAVRERKTLALAYIDWDRFKGGGFN